MSELSKERTTTHDYAGSAKEYAKLGIEKTFFIAFQEMERIVNELELGGVALDIGCGAGRSTRFLRDLGFNCTGFDIEESQVQAATSADPDGDYRVSSQDQISVDDGTADLTLSCIVLLECPSKDALHASVKELARVTKPGGKVIVVTNTEESFRNDWASFTCDLPENQALQSGERAKVIVRGTDAVLFDYYWTDQDYREAFSAAQLTVESCRRPIADGTEPFEWVSETEKPNWAIYVLAKEN